MGAGALTFEPADASSDGRRCADLRAIRRRVHGAPFEPVDASSDGRRRSSTCYRLVVAAALRLAILCAFACEPTALGPPRPFDGGRVNPYADGDFVPPLAYVEGAPPEYGLAAGVELFAIEAYQTVRIPLVEAARVVDPPRAPLFAGKDTFVRIYARPTERPGRSVRAIVRIEGEGDPLVVLSEERTLDTASAIDDPRSTLDVTLPSSVLVPGATLDVALVEYGGPGSAEARFPRDDTPLVLPLTDGLLDLVLVPIEHVDGGTTRAPIVDEATLANLRTDLRAFFPTNVVRVRTRAPMTWDAPLPPASPNAWNDLLDAVTALRSDEATSNEYFVALVNPGESFEAYCGLACVAGIAPVNVDDLSSMRVAIALGFGDLASRMTVVHELGHAHGRGHAPCGVTSMLDDTFPHADGLIGDWGWDARTRALVAPSAGDFMGYCEPRWTSPYTFLRLHQRIGSGAAALHAPGAPHHVFSIAPFRAPRWSFRAQEAQAPTGAMVEAFDGGGRRLGLVSTRRVPSSIPGFERLVVPHVDGVARYEHPRLGSLRVPAL